MEAINASDLHIKAGRPPCYRCDGELKLANLPSLTPEETLKFAKEITPKRLLPRLERGEETDFGFGIKDVGRFRANVFFQRGSVGIVIRRVLSRVPDIESLGLPKAVRQLAEEPRGLILVTGTAGSGKTTTLAAMIQHMNETRRAHIVTIEDPIEVLHRDNLCLIDQREIGIDTKSYAEALRNVVRQDPNVILIGEMRDQETVGAALTSAEIGTLVLSTLHTIDASETINRIIDFFPPYQQQQIRAMLSSTLRGIISMRLLPKIGGGRVPAVEVLVASANVKDLILKGKIDNIKEAIDQGKYYGMQTFEASLVDLYKNKLVTLEDAISMAANAHDFQLRLRKLGILEAQPATAST
jgi:twitching motility protein PilT